MDEPIIKIEEILTAYKSKTGQIYNWDSKSRIYAGRDNNLNIYITVLKCSIPKLNLKTIKSMKLNFKIDQWASSGVSVVLFSKEVEKASLVYDFWKTLTSDSLPEGYIATFAPGEKNENGDQISWSSNFSEEQFNILNNHLQVNETNYLYFYFTRIQNLSEYPEKNSWHYTKLYKPASEEGYGIEIEYEENNYYLMPQDPIISGSGHIKFDIYEKTESGDTIYNPESPVWGYQIFDKNNQEFETSDIIFDENGNFTFGFFQEGYAIVKVTFEGVSISTKVVFPPKWPYLKSWIVGYAMKMMGSFLPPSAPIAYQYSNDLILPACDLFFKEKMPTCLARDPILSNVYYFYRTIDDSYSFIYNLEDGTVSIKKDGENAEEAQTEIEILVYKIDIATKKQSWFISQQNIAIEPIWTSCDIKDKNGNVKIKTYKPIPIYNGGF